MAIIKVVKGGKSIGEAIQYASKERYNVRKRCFFIL